MPRIILSLTAAVVVIALLHVTTAEAADPTVADCLAASDSSLRAASDHKLRAERSQLLVCASPSCPADIRKECIAEVEEVNAEIPTVIFWVKDSAGSDLGAVRVFMDGELLTEQLDGTSLSIDPGPHTFRFEAAGLTPLTKQLLVQQAQKDRREPITIDLMGKVPQAPPLVGEPTATRPSSGLGVQKTLALVAGGLGLAGLGLGAGFGAVALSRESDAQSVCPKAQCPTLDGLNAWRDAASAGDVSTVGFVVAGVAVAASTILWLTASNGKSHTQVGAGPRVVQAQVTW